MDEQAVNMSDFPTGPITYTQDDYGLAIRSAVRGLWTGTFDPTGFVMVMMDTIVRGLRLAWFAGAEKCGIKPDELSPEELTALDDQINIQYEHLFGFADYISLHRKADGGLLRSSLNRAKWWTNAYRDTYNRAQQMACRDQKLKWVWNPAKEHCVDCARLNGRVYRASIWAKYNIRPQSRDLACHGIACGCEFVPTSEPCTPGRPPALSGG